MTNVPPEPAVAPDPRPDLPPQPTPQEKPLPNGTPAHPPEPGPDLPNRTPDPAPRPLSGAAQRALTEAEERRKKAKDMEMPPELGGRDGPEPVRFGDWEKKGIAVDF